MGEGLTFSSNGSSYGVQINIRSGFTANNLIFKPKLQKGTKATPYSPYGMGTANVVVGNKNLADLSTFVNGYVEFYGTFANLSTQGEKRSDFIKVNPNTDYTFKIIETGSTYPNWIGIGLYSKNNVDGFITRSAIYGDTITITTGNTTKYIVVSARNLAQATKIQLEENTTATSYTPHAEQDISIPCQRPMSIGDYFDRENEEEVHLRKQIKLSDLTWSYSSANQYFYSNELDIIATAAGTMFPGLCTHYAPTDTQNNAAWANKSTGVIGQRTSLKLICIKDTRYTTVENFVEAMENTIIEYELEEPERLPFTSEQKEVAKQIKQAKSYYEQTHIYSTDETSPIFNVEACAEMD